MQEERPFLVLVTDDVIIQAFVYFTPIRSDTSK